MPVIEKMILRAVRKAAGQSGVPHSEDNLVIGHPFIARMNPSDFMEYKRSMQWSELVGGAASDADDPNKFVIVPDVSVGQGHLLVDFVSSLEVEQLRQRLSE